MTIARIACATDFSACATRALDIAIGHARRHHATLAILHAEVAWQATGEGTRRLDEAVARARKAEIGTVHGHHLEGPAWRALDAFVKASFADLLVVGTHGCTGACHVSLGSIAEHIVRYARVPVLSVHPDDRAEPPRRVLIATDLTEFADRTTELALGLAAPNAEVELVHFVEAQVDGCLEVVQAIESAANATLQQVVARFGHRVHGACHRGDPRQVLLERLARDDFDLVVIGRHERSGMERSLGTIAELAVRHARCPVLVGSSADRA